MNVNVGFIDDRNSSRVLKPPGGGTSDIFGTRYEKPAPQKVTSAEAQVENKVEEVSKENGKSVDDTVKNNENNKEANGDVANEEVKSNGTKIEEIKTEEVTVEETTVAEQKIEELKIEDSKSEEKSEQSVGKSVYNNIIQEPDNTPKKPSGKRVPPGGFSSGLW